MRRQATAVLQAALGSPWATSRSTSWWWHMRRGMRRGAQVVAGERLRGMLRSYRRSAW